MNGIRDVVRRVLINPNDSANMIAEKVANRKFGPNEVKYGPRRESSNDPKIIAEARMPREIRVSNHLLKLEFSLSVSKTLNRVCKKTKSRATIRDAVMPKYLIPYNLLIMRYGRRRMNAQMNTSNPS